VAEDRAPASAIIPSIGHAERERLLVLARAAVERATRSEPWPDWSAETGALRQPAAAFVTLRAGHQLRGCIGCVEPRHWSLAETVVRMATAASQEDLRFSRVREEELRGLTVEISVLGPLVPVERLEQVRVGRDGLVVEDRGHRGLLLPQVATEWQWDLETFVSQACRKAGLPPDAWRTGARLYRFEALVFGEGDAGNQ